MDEPERTRRAAAARVAADKLIGDRIGGVAATWVDTTGITRVKAVPVERLEHAAAWGIGASPVFDAFLVDDSVGSGRFAGGPVGDLRLYPDLSRLTALAATPGWAWAPVDRYTQEGAPHPCDARTACRDAVESLAAQGFELKAAFEIEWCVSRGDGDEFVPACSGPAYGMTRLTELSDYLAAVLDALRRQGVAVDQIHPEYAPGQYELSVAAEDPVGAADTAVLVRETIRAVSAAHGLRATFAPKVLAEGVGNGGHVHLSLWRDGVNAMAGGDRRYSMTATGEAFAAGILHRLPALLALGAPSVASHLRLVPSHWAGAFACWGRENREAPLRWVTGSTGEQARAANLEIKCFDQAGNPYLVLAGVIAAGLAGVAADATLPDPVEVDPAGLPETDRPTPLPTTVEESVTAFEADPTFTTALGEPLTDTIAAIHRADAALFADATPDHITATTRWRY